MDTEITNSIKELGFFKFVTCTDHNDVVKTETCDLLKESPFGKLSVLVESSTKGMIVRRFFFEYCNEEGYLASSTIEDVSFVDNNILIITKNSKYIFRKCSENDVILFSKCKELLDNLIEDEDY